MSTVCSLDELIDVLGGPTRTAEKLGESGANVVVNWRARGKLPAHRFIAHREALERLDIKAPEHLWFVARKREAA